MYFYLTITLERILTTDNLRRRGNYNCGLVLHVQIYGLVCGLPCTTFHCCLGVLVTSPLFIWGSWVLPNSLIILFASWKGKFGNTNSRDIWVVVPLYLMWCLWREGNSSYFWRERVSGDPAEVSFSQGCILNFEWTNQQYYAIFFTSVLGYDMKSLTLICIFVSFMYVFFFWHLLCILPLY